MSDSLLRRNLELKARHPDLAAARETVRRLGAQPAGTEDQTDTFFHVPQGRLKLREIDGRPAVLIWYDRPDDEGVRPSRYHLVTVEDPAGLRAALAAGLGVRGQVRKRREIFLWHNVRVHLDEVAGLGTFVEFEAVLSPTEDEAISQARLDRLGETLAIDSSLRVSRSYVDLLGL
jgi:predicted adenylyl cyclase CyaB